MIKNNRNLEVFNCEGVKVFYGPRGSGKSKKLTEYMELHTLEKEDFNNKFLEVTTKSLMINMEKVKAEEYNNDFLMGYNVFANKKDDIIGRNDYDVFIDEAENYVRETANEDILFCLNNLDVKQKIKFIVSYLKREFPNLKAISMSKQFNYDFINGNNRSMEIDEQQNNSGMENLIEKRWNELTSKNPDIEKILKGINDILLEIYHKQNEKQDKKEVYTEQEKYKLLEEDNDECWRKNERNKNIEGIYKQATKYLTKRPTFDINETNEKLTEIIFDEKLPFKNLDRILLGDTYTVPNGEISYKNKPIIITSPIVFYRIGKHTRTSGAVALFGKDGSIDFAKGTVTDCKNNLEYLVFFSSEINKDEIIIINDDKVRWGYIRGKE